MRENKALGAAERVSLQGHRGEAGGKVNRDNQWGKINLRKDRQQRELLAWRVSRPAKVSRQGQQLLIPRQIDAGMCDGIRGSNIPRHQSSPSEAGASTSRNLLPPGQPSYLALFLHLPHAPSVYRTICLLHHLSTA